MALPDSAGRHDPHLDRDGRNGRCRDELPLPGDKALCVRGGKFGERWTEICSAYGIIPVNIDVEWGTAVDPQKIEDSLKADPAIKAVYFQASETSTGVMHPTKEIAEICRKREGTICVVDAITAAGVFDLPMDSWGLDVVVTGSQRRSCCRRALGSSRPLRRRGS